jgi:hypothetical protein
MTVSLLSTIYFEIYIYKKKKVVTYKRVKAFSIQSDEG